MSEKLITVKDASELLSINPFSLYKMALQRKIPSVKLGKLRRFKESELMAWVEKHRVKEIEK